MACSSAIRVSSAQIKMTLDPVNPIPERGDNRNQFRNNQPARFEFLNCSRDFTDRSAGHLL